MKTTANKKQIKARTIVDLCGKLTDEWYDSVEGVYSDNVPTWGPETDAVRNQIGSSCAEGDIVSWDTRPKNVMRHRYLLRRWTPASQTQEHQFFVITHEEYEERG